MKELLLRMQDKLSHDLILPEETREIRGAIREFAEKEIEPVAYELGHQEETKGNFPKGLFNRMASRGYFQIPFPKENGGRGLRYPVCATVVAIEELA